LLVAFLGDQGLGTSAEQVLELVKSEGADAVVHIGDFDYIDAPTLWLAQIDKILGAEFPYFSVIGNHEGTAWLGENGYGQIIAKRQARIPSMRCVGDPGIKYACRFKGLGLVFSCVGNSDVPGHGDCSKDSPEQLEFLRSALRSEVSPWKICVWHKTQFDFQVGYKADEVGMAAYDACFSQGAIVANAHEHSYSRTYVLSNLLNRSESYGKVGTDDRLEVSPGRSFVFVSGLGGDSIRSYNPAHDSDAWFAAYNTSTRWLKSGLVRDGMNQYGALFVRFNVMGNPRQAWGYFKNIDARILDEFTILRAESNETPP
jgi:3',5'-cyclic AMP phosphodiesterase CpdA